MGPAKTQRRFKHLGPDLLDERGTEIGVLQRTQPAVSARAVSASTTFTTGVATALSIHSAWGCFIPGEASLLRGRRHPNILLYVNGR